MTQSSEAGRAAFVRLELPRTGVLHVQSTRHHSCCRSVGAGVGRADGLRSRTCARLLRRRPRDGGTASAAGRSGRRRAGTRHGLGRRLLELGRRTACVGRRDTGKPRRPAITRGYRIIGWPIVAAGVWRRVTGAVRSCQLADAADAADAALWRSTAGSQRQRTPRTIARRMNDQLQSGGLRAARESSLLTADPRTRPIFSPTFPTSRRCCSTRCRVSTGPASTCCAARTWCWARSRASRPARASPWVTVSVARQRCSAPPCWCRTCMPFRGISSAMKLRSPKWSLPVLKDGRLVGVLDLDSPVARPLR